MIRNRAAHVALVLCLLLAFLLATWALVQFVVLPKAIPSWQSAVVITTAAILSLLAALGAVAQITGYSLRDFQAKHLGDSRPPSQVRRLIQDIRANLYGSDAQLPIVLSQALELCDQLGYSDYRTWIRKELAGFAGYDRLGSEFDSAETFDRWRKEWVPHRMIKTYLKFSYLSERGSYEIDELPYDQILIATPIRTIIENVDGAKANHTDELYVKLVRLGPDRLEAVRDTMQRIAPAVEVPHDLQVFTRRAEYERLLFGVRDRISQLLSVAYDDQRLK